jgi:hypothetical protein
MWSCCSHNEFRYRSRAHIQYYTRFLHPGVEGSGDALLSRGKFFVEVSELEIFSAVYYARVRRHYYRQGQC